MEPMNLHFDVRDIFRSPRLALSGKKIWDIFICQCDWICCLFYSELHCNGLIWCIFWETWGQPKVCTLCIYR